MKKNYFLSNFQFSQKRIKAVMIFITVVLFGTGVFVQKANAQLLNEPFTSSLDGWTAVVGSGDAVSVTATANAGGTADEVTIVGNSQSTSITDRLYSPAVNTTGMTSLTLTWNNYLLHYSSSYAYSAYVQTSSDGVTWHNTTWVYSPVTATIAVGLQTLTIATSDVGSATFRVAFTVVGLTFGMDDWYIDNVHLVSNCIAPTTTYSVTGGSSCTSSDIGLSGSQAGVTYQLFDGSTAVGPTQLGTGSAIDFGTQTAPGIYTVQTTNAGGYCVATMTGSASISVPSQPSAITGSTTPSVGTSQTYSVTNISGLTYTWAFPADWTQTAGGTTNSVNVTVGAQNGTISVTPSNTCGSGTAQTLAVNVSLTTSGSSTFTWICPSDVTTIQVEMWGGGAGGGGASNTTNYAGAGGGGGAYTKNAAVTVTPGTTYTISIGAAGTAGTTSTNGGNGGITTATFGSTTVTANGGTGGTKGTSTSGAAGGAGATASSGTGVTSYAGGAGHASTSGAPGGGGGGAGSTGAGNAGGAGPSAGGGAAMSNNGGAGGNGGSASGAGSNGSVYGGAGGGGGKNKAGGAGAGGYAVITTIPTFPVISVSALTSFGSVCANGTVAGPNSFTITGTNLTTANVTVGALTGFTYSTTSGGTYTSTLSLTQTGGSYSQIIYVKFTPIAYQSYNGTISVGGGGAATANAAAVGTGVNSAPTVTTPTSGNITTTTAILGGNITALGCSNVIERGIFYSTTSGFANGTGTKVSETTGAPFTTGTFIENVSGLNPSITYYYKAYAVNSGGTAYSAQGTFNTLCGSISTLPWTENFDEMTTVGASILPNCWSTVTGTVAFTTKSTTDSYHAANSGANYIDIVYGGTVASSLWTPAFNLTAGMPYVFSFKWAGDGYSGWTASALVNTTASATGATTLSNFLTATTTTVETYTTTNITYTPTTTGIYYFGVQVSSTSVPFYLGFDDFSLIISPPVGGSVSGPSTLCTGTNGTQYIYNGGSPVATGWAWTVPTGASIIAGAGTDTITVNWATASSGNVTCTPSFNGSAGTTVSKAVTVNNLPTVTFTAQPGANACIGTNETYTTQAGMTNYVWGFSGVLGTDYTIISGDTSTSNTVTLQYLSNTSNIVTVNYTNSNGCTAFSPTSSTASIVQSPTTFDFTGGSILPAANPSCYNTTLTYSAPSSSIYWETAMNGNVITHPTTSTYPVTTTGIYYAREFNGTCWSNNTVSDSITIYTLTIPPISGGASAVCLNGSTPAFTDSISGGTWSITSGTGTATITPDGIVTGTSLGTVTIIYTYNNDTCTNTASSTLMINPPPAGGTATATVTTLCAGTGTTITLTGASGGIQWQQSTDSITWVNVTGGSGANSATYTTPLLTATTYYMAVINNAGCPTVYSTVASVTVNPLPSPVEVDSSGTYCTSTALTASGGIGGTIYWESTLATGTYTQQPSNFQIIAQSGTYYFRARTALGCWGSSSGAIVVINNPPVSGNATATSTTLCYGSGTTITLSGYTGNNIQWQQSADGVTGWTNVTGGSGATTATYTTPNPLPATTYYMAVVSSGGCPSATSNVVEVTFTNNVTSTTPAARCGIGAVTLNATASSGTIKWYANPIGGLSLATGSPYTPTVNTTTTYYVDAETGTSITGSVTIGTGTTATSTSAFPTLYSEYGGFQDWQQIVYTAAELQAQGLAAGNITALKFNVATLYLTTNPTAFTLSLGLTSNSVLSTFQTTGLSTVYGPATPTPTTGWNTFTFSTPYNWDGVSNILVDIRMLEAYADIETDATYYTATTGNTVLYAYSATNNTSFWTSNPTPTTSTSRFNAIFSGQVGNACASPRTAVVATVTPPAALTISGNQNVCQNAVTSMSVTSNIPDFNTYIWSPTTNLYMDSAATTAYNGTSITTVYVKSTVVDTITYSCTATNTTTLCANIATSTVTVMPIPTSVTATASSSTICQGSSVNLTSSGVSHSPNINPVNFNEGFEESGSFPPTGWANLQGGSGNLWTIVSYGTAHGGSYAAEYQYNSSYAANAWLISSGISLIGGTTYTISYWENTGSLTEKLKVTVGTAQTIAGQTTTLQTLASLTNSTYTKQTTTYNCPTTGIYYFGWNCYSAKNEEYLDIDDISITGSSIAPPTYVWTSNPTGYTSTVQNPTGVVPNVNTQYTVTASNVYGCIASANTATVTLNTPSIGGTATATSANLCTGTGTTITLTGNTGTIQWQQSANGTTGWANVTGGSGATTATYTTPNLTATTYYRAVVTSGVCTSANSTTAMVTVNNLSVGGTATASSPIICYNGNTSIALTAYNGTIQWQQSSNGNTNWTNVTGGSGANTATYTTPNLTATTYYMAVVTSGACSSTNSNVDTISFPYPTAQPTNILLAAGVTSVIGSFTASASADNYLIVRSTSSTLSAAPLNGTTYDVDDMLGGGTILAYQTGTSINDIGLLWNTPYYYFVFAANNLTCTNGPVYLTTSPLIGTTTTTMPPVTNKTLNITAMLQEYYNGTGMNQTQGIDWDSGDLFNNFQGTIVDTLTVLIRETNVTDPFYPCTIDTALYGQSINVDGTITPISIASGITGYHYIVIIHRNSIETWSDSVDFSTDTISYNFYSHISQFAQDGGMYIDGSNLAYIWGGDVNQNGNLESEDATAIYVAAISDDETVNNGYVINDVDGNGNIDSQDYGLAYSNSIVGANVINPFSYQKKK